MSTLTESEAAILLKDGQLIATNVASMVSDSMFWGMHIVLFAFAMYCLRVSSSRTKARYFALALVPLLFMMSTALFVLHLSQAFSVAKKIMLTTEVTDMNLRNRSTFTVRGPLAYVGNWVFSFEFLLGDAIVIWRTWVLWRGSLAICLPIMLWMASLCVLATERILWVATGKYAIFLGFGGPMSLPSLRATNYVLSLATNAVSTGMIVWLAWKYRVNVKWTLNHSGPNPVERIFALLVESGLLYLFFWSVAIMTNFEPWFTPMTIFIEMWTAAGNQVVGFYPTVIIALVELQRTMRDSVDIEPPTLSIPPIDEAPHSANTHDIPESSVGIVSLMSNI